VAIVLDASVASAWFFEDERDEEALATLTYLENDVAFVPALWRWEIQNVLHVAERRGRLTEAGSSLLVGTLRLLQIRVDAQGADPTFGTELRLARRHQISVYDAAYLELAERLALPIATRDKKLAASAHDAGVPLFRPVAKRRPRAR